MLKNGKLLTNYSEVLEWNVSISRDTRKSRAETYSSAINQLYNLSTLIPKGDRELKFLQYIQDFRDTQKIKK